MAFSLLLFVPVSHGTLWAGKIRESNTGLALPAPSLPLGTTSAWLWNPSRNCVPQETFLWRSACCVCLAAGQGWEICPAVFGGCDLDFMLRMAWMAWAGNIWTWIFPSFSAYLLSLPRDQVQESHQNQDTSSLHLALILCIWAIFFNNMISCIWFVINMT